MGVLGRPYFTRRSQMELVQNLQAYCERRWVSKLSVHTLSPATCQRQAQEAQEHSEQRESSPSIRERTPKLKVQASVLPATQAPKPLTGRGGGKKNPDLFAANFVLAHRHSKGIAKPYELLRPAKQAASAVCSVPTADARPSRDKARSPERTNSSPACDLNPEQPPLMLNVKRGWASGPLTSSQAIQRRVGRPGA